MKKTVVHIAKVTGIHGTEKHLLELLPELNKIYNIVYIVLTEPGTPVPEYFEMLKKRGIRTHNIRIHSNIDPVCLFKLQRILKRLKPDIVHTHLIHGDIYGTAAACLTGIERIISTKHNDDSFRCNAFLKKINSFFNRRTKSIIAISNSVADFISSIEGVNPSKIETIYYGLSTPTPERDRGSIRRELGLTDKEVVFIIVARLVKQKGHHYLIEGFYRALQDNSDIRLLIVGEGELKNSLMRQVEKRKLSRVIQFTGYRTDIADMLCASDIFIHPSLWEGFGLSILEAMACGLPVIATRVSAIPELIEDAVSGLLVPPEEPEALAHAISRLSSDEHLRKSLGQSAKRRWEDNFSIENMVRKTHNHYETVLKA